MEARSRLLLATTSRTHLVHDMKRMNRMIEVDRFSMLSGSKLTKFARRVAVIASVAVTAGVPTAAPGFEKAMVWGVNGHPLTAYGGVPIETQLDLVAKAGLRSYRIDVTNTDQIGRLETIVSAANARGVDILPVLIPPADLNNQSEAALYQTGQTFGRAFVSRLGSRVTTWELGNELEIYALIKPCERRDDGTIYPCTWGVAGGVGELDYVGARVKKVAALLRGLAEGTREANPAVRRAVGSAGWGHVGIFNRLRAEGVDWEISVWHMYGEDPEWAFKALKTLDRPIWVTEFNHPFGSKQDGESKQSEGLAATMSRLQALSATYRVEGAFIYELLDETYWAPSFEAYMGLVRLDKTPDGWRAGSPKPAFESVSRVVAQP